MDKLSARSLLLCFSSHDNGFERLAEFLKICFPKEFNVSYHEFDDHDESSQEVSSSLHKHLTRGDYLIIVLTESSANSVWLGDILNNLELRYRFRDINIIFLRLDSCVIPEALLNEFCVDYRDQNGLPNLIRVLRYSYFIDFIDFNQDRFNDLIFDLLQSLGFTNLDRDFKMKFSMNYIDLKDKFSENYNDSTNFSPISEYTLRFDFKGEYAEVDPFGYINKTLWMIEVKFQKDRINPRFINQIGRSISKLPEKYKLAVITNGHLTNASRDSIDKLQNNSRVQIKIIDKPKLKKILVEHPLIIEKYFGRLDEPFRPP